MTDERGADEVRKLYEALVKRISTFAKGFGFSQKGSWFWKASTDGDLFAGFQLARPPGRPRTKRLTFGIEIYGGARDLYRLDPTTGGQEFGPLVRAAQYNATLLEGQHGKQWTLFPSTSIDTVFADISQRLTTEAFPLIDQLIDPRRLPEMIASERVWTGGPMVRDRYIRELDRRH